MGYGSGWWECVWVGVESKLAEGSGLSKGSGQGLGKDSVRWVCAQAGDGLGKGIAGRERSAIFSC